MGGSAYAGKEWQLGRTAAEVTAIEAEAVAAGKTPEEIAATKPLPVQATATAAQVTPPPALTPTQGDPLVVVKPPEATPRHEVTPPTEAPAKVV